MQPFAKQLQYAAFIAALLMPSCDNPAPTLPTGGSGGFIIGTIFVPYNQPGRNAGGVKFNMDWEHDGLSAGGDASPIRNQMTSPEGLWSSLNGRAPALWGFSWLGTGAYPACATAPDNGIPINVNKDEVTNVACYGPPGATGYNLKDPPAYAVIPNPINIAKPPPRTEVVAAAGTFMTTYGMPVAQYFDLSGNLIGEQQASSVSASGAIAYSSTPDLSGLGPGTYAGTISNINSQGAYVMAASVYLTLINTGCNPNCPPVPTKASSRR